MAVTRNAVVELFWRVHPMLYRWSGGRIGGAIGGMPVLLLTTTGRKSGAPRTTALTYLPRGDDFVVIASVLGEPRHPAWWLNLAAKPDATVQVGGTRHAVRARQAEGEEREALWRAVVAKTPDYDEYKARTSRRIPVVVLERGRA
jgi:deazaflavin-dependent oxidoreductase (nitroreductase family)